MEIKTFCKDETTENLQKMWNDSIATSENIIKRFSEPNIISNITEAVQNKCCSEMDEIVIELAMCYLANHLNIEVIERELFRRKMEDAGI